MKKLNIAIIGLGNIGSYLYKYLNQNKKIISKKNNCIPNITYISAKNKNRKRNFKINKKIWLKNYLDATKNKNVDLIVELIGGAEGPAKKLVFNALKNKKHVGLPTETYDDFVLFGSKDETIFEETSTRRKESVQKIVSQGQFTRETFRRRQDLGRTPNAIGQNQSGFGENLGSFGKLLHSTQTYRGTIPNRIHRSCHYLYLERRVSTDYGNCVDERRVRNRLRTLQHRCVSQSNCM